MARTKMTAKKATSGTTPQCVVAYHCLPINRWIDGLLTDFVTSAMTAISLNILIEFDNNPRHSHTISTGDPLRSLKVLLSSEASAKGHQRLKSLPKLLYASLKDYHMQDSLVYEEVIFDFGMDEKLVRWSKKASLLVHSKVNWGNLFAGKDRNGNDVAMEVEDFMNCLFIPTLDRVVYASTLFMLMCGHLVAFEELYLKMKQAIMHLRPEYTIMFTALDFISAVVKAFVMTYSIQVLIQGHNLLAIFQDLLNTSIDLHMHTDRFAGPQGPIWFKTLYTQQHHTSFNHWVQIFMVPQPLPSLGQGSAHGMLEVWHYLSVVPIETGARRFLCKGPGDGCFGA
ncbi:hypothetical protein BKA83DRAFT_4122551 [Pisolithus microcarpus]|nr:hypothetical protein BKA83DRAFT_4122551 [Pisolithus microcarpus]